MPTQERSLPAEKNGIGIPFISHRSSLCVNAITSSLDSGQLNLPFSSRFSKRQNPFLSHCKILMMSRFRLQKANRDPESGLCLICTSTTIDSVLIDLRMSVAPRARYTCAFTKVCIIPVPAPGSPCQGSLNQNRYQSLPCIAPE